MPEHQSDHDLLIRIASDLHALNEKIDDYMDRTQKEIDRLWDNKASKTDIALLGDHETRIRRLETWTWRLIGGAVTLEVIANYFLHK